MYINQLYNYKSRSGFVNLHLHVSNKRVVQVVKVVFLRGHTILLLSHLVVWHNLPLAHNGHALLDKLVKSLNVEFVRGEKDTE